MLLWWKQQETFSTVTVGMCYAGVVHVHTRLRSQILPTISSVTAVSGGGENPLRLADCWGSTRATCQHGFDSAPQFLKAASLDVFHIKQIFTVGFPAVCHKNKYIRRSLGARVATKHVGGDRRAITYIQMNLRVVLKGKVYIYSIRHVYRVHHV